MNISITGLGTATPPLHMTQEEMYEFFVANFELSSAEKDLYRRILVNGRIKGRFVGLDSRDAIVDTDHDHLLARFLKYGLSTACTAARTAIQEAGITGKDIKGLVVNTCTGYLCPGLSSYIAEMLELPKTIRIMDLMGMGCGAAVPNLECAAGMIARSDTGPVLSIAVEVCSATFFPSHEPELIVSNCIFSDGAAAVVVDASHSGNGRSLARILDFESGLFPEYREELRYRHQGGLLRNSLTKRVPVIGAQTIAAVVSRLLARHGLHQDEIDWWAVHPGGTMVLEQVAKHMRLAETSLQFSYDIFENYGNMSSPSVLFVLRKVLDNGRPHSGQKGLLLSFGAGFSAFAALVEF